jgi:4-hydroxybenzoate polyprenyltransferase
MAKFRNYLSLVKFSHTIFAMPFAAIGFFLGVEQMGEGISLWLLLLVLGCMVFARSAAMAFNRWADRDIDKKNPRTAGREIPAGTIKARSALLFVILSSLAFITCTWFINPICFYLSPLALLIILTYSYTKRFTALAHFVLGLGLSLAPIGAYLAVCGHFDVMPVLYSLLVLFWVGGFDIIYALQDKEFDSDHGLHSIPAALGLRKALMLSALAHVFCLIFLILTIILGNYSLLYIFGCIIFLVLLVYQHLIVKPSDLSRINQAFALVNGLAGLILAVFFVLDFFLKNSLRSLLIF